MEHKTMRDVIDADIVDAKHCDPIRPSDALSIFSRLSEYLDWRVVEVPEGTGHEGAWDVFYELWD